MIKQKSQFVCSNCNYSVSRWQGRCPNCGEWNTFAEVQVVATKGKAVAGSAKVTRLSELPPWEEERLNSGIEEFNVVLGGGLVPGSLVLLGGDPGVGKSTLALQSAVSLEKAGTDVLYISGEESGQQIRLRSDRLSKSNDLKILAETSLEVILATLQSEQPSVAIIDSIQTINSEQVNGVVGGVSQIAFATNSLMRMAKQNHIAIIIIGHVTKEGMLAGPKTLEHMVDTVLYLEGERFTSLRLLRCTKNRFGSAGEVGVFEMRGEGLAEVKNPGELFLEHRDQPLPGNVVTPTLEGNKVLLLEVQALTSPTAFGYPRRATSGFDLNRLQLLLAILQKRLGVNVSNQDVYINVAGGFKLDERAVDLPVALAILSSLSDVPVPEGVAAIGEIGLSGEVRSVTQLEKRVRECAKLGFSTLLVGGKVGASQGVQAKEVAVRPVRTVHDLMQYINGHNKSPQKNPRAGN